LEEPAATSFFRVFRAEDGGSWIISTKLYGIISQKKGILMLVSCHVLSYKLNRRDITSKGTEVVSL
jgi:hypothetical protein